MKFIWIFIFLIACQSKSIKNSDENLIGVIENNDVKFEFGDNQLITYNIGSFKYFNQAKYILKNENNGINLYVSDSLNGFSRILIQPIEKDKCRIIFFKDQIDNNLIDEYLILNHNIEYLNKIIKNENKLTKKGNKSFNIEYLFNKFFYVVYSNDTLGFNEIKSNIIIMKIENSENPLLFDKQFKYQNAKLNSTRFLDFKKEIVKFKEKDSIVLINYGYNQKPSSDACSKLNVCSKENIEYYFFGSTKYLLDSIGIEKPKY